MTRIIPETRSSGAMRLKRSLRFMTQQIMFYKSINRCMILGIYLALGLVFVGSLLFLIKYGSLPVSRIQPLVSASFRELESFKDLPVFFLATGFLLLLFIQGLRTLVITFSFLFKKDWHYFAISLIVSIFLIGSIASSYVKL